MSSPVSTSVCGSCVAGCVTVLSVGVEPGCALVGATCAIAGIARPVASASPDVVRASAMMIAVPFMMPLPSDATFCAVLARFHRSEPRTGIATKLDIGVNRAMVAGAWILVHDGIDATLNMIWIS